MSDGTMVLLIFGLIVLVGAGIPVLVIVLVRRSRARKEQAYTGLTVGTVVRRRYGGGHHSTVVWVRYEVDGVAYECREGVAMASEAIKVGPVPIGQRKVARIPSKEGSRVRVAYLPEDPSKAILADNQGLMGT